MTVTTIGRALGELARDPNNDAAWETLEATLRADDVDRMAAREELRQARAAHEMRREFGVVARLLGAEIELAAGSDDELGLVRERARVHDEELFDDEAAVVDWKRCLELAPADRGATESLERSSARRAKWTELVARYVEEAKDAREPAFKSSLLVSAAETAFRYGRPALKARDAKRTRGKRKRSALQDLLDEIVAGLSDALAIDPKNRRAAALLERVERERGNAAGVARALEHVVAEAGAREERVGALTRLARLQRGDLERPDEAIRTYERVLELSPGHPEATRALAEAYAEGERWDQLVSLYVEQLSTGAVQTADEVGALLQVGMIHWKKRGQPDAAEPFFERLRKIDPGHPGVLEFFRGWCEQRHDAARWAQVLADAQRALPDSDQRAQITLELAQAASESGDASKAIELYRAALRANPDDADARKALRALYRDAGAWAKLAELIRHDLGAAPEDAAEWRLTLLGELAELYRGPMSNEPALVSVLGQIVQLSSDPKEPLSELSSLYESLGRWRDWLATESRLADLAADPAEQVDRHRAVARRWLEQFNNVQHAIEAYERVYDAAPGDDEAYEKLRELYMKRRAYPQLMDLLAKHRDHVAEGDARIELTVEMAKLAAERLDRHADAIAWLVEVLEKDPTHPSALGTLERVAEREKRFDVLADVLERKVDLDMGDSDRLALLQKLGVICSERLRDHARAWRAWKAVLELSPGHAKALRMARDACLERGDFDALESLYRDAGDIEALADALSTAADRSEDPERRLELSRRAARVYAEDLGTPERAFRAYERVLSVAPEDVPAASGLLDLCRSSEKWSRMPGLYDVLVAHASDDERAIELLTEAAELAETRLHDPKLAFEYLRQRFDRRPTDDELGALREATERLGRFADFAEVLAREVGRESRTDDERRNLELERAELLARRLDAAADAIALLRKIVKDAPQDERAVEKLSDLLHGAGRRDEQRELFETRIASANTAQKIDLLVDWAVMEETEFDAPERAIVVYRRLLEAVPTHGAALKALGRLLRAQGEFEAALDVISTDRDQRAGSERADRDVEIADILYKSLDRPEGAVDAVRRALEEVPAHDDAVRVLESLVEVPSVRPAAAELLVSAYEAMGRRDRQVEALEIVIGTKASAEDRAELYVRLADVYERDLSQPAAAFDALTRAATDLPRRSELWDRLERIAKVTSRHEALVATLEAILPEGEKSGLPEAVERDLASRVATITADTLGDIARARPYLERLLDLDPHDHAAFDRLKQILTSLEQWEELERLYDRMIARATDEERVTELLGEAALVAGEIRADKAKTIDYYERLLELRPEHEHANRALDTLYTESGAWSDLVALLKGQLDSTSLNDTIAIRCRIGEIYLNHLDDAAAALGYLEEVLHTEPSNRQARELVEACLEVESQRARAAVVLEGVYVALDAVRDLVRVLEVRLESVSDEAERRDLLTRIAELRDERLNEGAFDAYAKLLPVAPDDSGARERLLALARKLGAHEDAAAVLAASADKLDDATDAESKLSIVRDLAELYQDDMDDAARAETRWRKVLELAGTDADRALEAVRALERIYEEREQSRELFDVLGKELELGVDSIRRSDIYARRGELAETKLGDAKLAIEAYTARLDESPGDPPTLEALDRLYEREGQYRPLVEILRQREQIATDSEERMTLLLRLARVLANRLEDVTEAIGAYRILVDDFGPTQDVLVALEALNEMAERWFDLAETIEMHVDLVSEQEKVGLMCRLGALRLTRIHDPAGAIDAFRESLEIEPGNQGARMALEGLLEHPDVGRDAAMLLKPLYVEGEQIDKRLATIDVLLAGESSIAESLDLLEEAIDVAEADPAFADRALDYALRAARMGVGEPEIARWVSRARDLADRLEKPLKFVELVEDIGTEILDGDVQVGASLDAAKRAMVADDSARGEALYRRILELRPDEVRALEALEGIYRDRDDYPSLLEIVRRRVDATESDDAKMPLYIKLGNICENYVRDASAAIDAYEALLDIGPMPEGFAALERLYRETARHSDLLDMLERRVEIADSDDERVRLRIQRGRILLKELANPSAAVDEFELALGVQPASERVADELSPLLEHDEVAARVGELLEPIYVAQSDWKKVRDVLSKRLRVADDVDERGEFLLRLARLQEEQLEDFAGALDTHARRLADDLRDEGIWEDLERVARVADASGRVPEIYAAELSKIGFDDETTAELARRAASLYRGEGKRREALELYRRAYSFAPEDDWNSFDAIDAILGELGEHEERVKHLRAGADTASDTERRLGCMLSVASICESKLEDIDRAIVTLREAIEIDTGDDRPVRELDRLLRSPGHGSELVEWLRSRAEAALSGEDEAAHRLDLARVLLDMGGDAHGAVDELEATLRAAGATNPSATEAIGLLERLLLRDELKARVVDVLRPVYEELDDVRKLVALNGERLGIAEDAGERVAVLKETAEWLERRLGQTDRAFAALKEAFALDPADDEVRMELERLAEALGDFDQLADAYVAAVGAADDLVRGELLVRLAEIHDSERGDLRAALDTWDELSRLRSDDEEPLDKMDSLAVLLGDWPVLVRVLAKKADIINDDFDRAALWRRIGEVQRDMMDAVSAALDAFERSLELDGSSPGTLDALIRIYEARSDAARLVDLYRRRVDICSTDEHELRRDLLIRAAECVEQGLREPRSALDLYREALGDHPGDRDILGRIEKLLVAERMFVDLVDNLREQLEYESDVGSRLVLKRRVGDLLATELDEPREAIEIYREVLDERPDDSVIEALFSIGESREDLRQDAVEALEGPLEQTERWPDLIRSFELRLRSEIDAPGRVDALRAIASVSRDRLDDRKQELEALLRAIREMPEDVTLLDDAETSARAVGRDGIAQLVKRVQDRVSTVFDTHVAAELHLRAARLLETELDDAEGAAAAYAAACEQRGDEPEWLEALDRLYVRLGNQSALADVLERRLGVEMDSATQAELYRRLAALQRDVFGEKSQAFASLRSAAELDPSNDAVGDALEAFLEDTSLSGDAFEVLEIYRRAREELEAVAALHSRRVSLAHAGSERARAALEHARFIADELEDPARALAALAPALDSAPTDPDVLIELERFGELGANWSDIAPALLAGLRADSDDGNRPARHEAWLRAVEWYRDRAMNRAAAEEALLEWLKQNSRDLAMLDALEELRREVGDARGIVDVLQMRARAEDSRESRLERLREAASLVRTELSDRPLLQAILRDIVKEAPDDVEALLELAELLESADDPQAVVELLLQAADADLDADRSRETRLKAAGWLEERLSEPERAIAVYERVFDDDASSAAATDRLRALYESRGDHLALGTLLRRMIDASLDPDDRRLLRLELGRRLTERGEAEQAVDVYQAVVGDEPGQLEATDALGHLFAQLERHADLADLFETRIGLAAERGDFDGEAALRMELAGLLDGSLDDAPRALDTLLPLLDRDDCPEEALTEIERVGTKAESWSEVDRALDTLARRRPSDVDVAMRLARVRDETGDIAGKEEALRRLLGEDPTVDVARNALIELFERDERIDELAQFLEEEAGQLASRYAQENASAGEGVKIFFASAEASMQSAMRLSIPPAESDDSSARMSLSPGSSRPSMAPPPEPEGPVRIQLDLLKRAGQLYGERLGDTDAAIRVLESARSLAGADRELLNSLAQLYRGSDRLDEAASVLRTLVTTFAGRRAKELAEVLRMLGDVLERQGETRAAYEELNHAFRVDPSSVVVLRDLGRLALEVEELDTAQKAYRALLLQRLDEEIGVTKAEVFLRLGTISERLGESDKAAQSYRRALENDADLVEAKDRLDALLASGE